MLHELSNHCSLSDLRPKNSLVMLYKCYVIYTHTNQVYITLGIQSPCQMMIGVYNHLLRKVFRFHYHSEKVFGSIGLVMTHDLQ